MKAIAVFLFVSFGFFGISTFARGLECTTDSPVMDYLTLDQEGGEETITVYYLSEAKTRYLVTYNKDGNIIAVHDNDLDKESSTSGVAIILNEDTRVSYLAINGNIIPVQCHKK